MRDRAASLGIDLATEARIYQEELEARKALTPSGEERHALVAPIVLLGKALGLPWRELAHFTGSEFTIRDLQSVKQDLVRVYRQDKLIRGGHELLGKELDEARLRRLVRDREFETLDDWVAEIAAEIKQPPEVSDTEMSHLQQMLGDLEPGKLVDSLQVMLRRQAESYQTRITEIAEQRRLLRQWRQLVRETNGPILLNVETV